MVSSNNTKLIPSTTTFKVYKRYKTYKGKVIIVDGNTIKSEIVDIERKSKDEALADAQAKLAELQASGNY